MALKISMSVLLLATAACGESRSGEGDDGAVRGQILAVVTQCVEGGQNVDVSVRQTLRIDPDTIIAGVEVTKDQESFAGSVVVRDIGQEPGCEDLAILPVPSATDLAPRDAPLVPLQFGSSTVYAGLVGEAITEVRAVGPDGAIVRSPSPTEGFALVLASPGSQLQILDDSGLVTAMPVVADLDEIPPEVTSREGLRGSTTSFIEALIEGDQQSAATLVSPLAEPDSLVRPLAPLVMGADLTRLVPTAEGFRAYLDTSSGCQVLAVSVTTALMPRPIYSYIFSSPGETDCR